VIISKSAFIRSYDMRSAFSDISPSRVSFQGPCVNALQNTLFFSQDFFEVTGSAVNSRIGSQTEWGRAYATEMMHRYCAADYCPLCWHSFNIYGLQRDGRILPTQ